MIEGRAQLQQQYRITFETVYTSAVICGRIVGDDALRTEGNTVDVGTEILQQALWRAEGWLDTDAPAPAGLGSEMPPEVDQAGEFGEGLPWAGVKGVVFIGLDQQRREPGLVRLPQDR